MCTSGASSVCSRTRTRIQPVSATSSFLQLDPERCVATYVQSIRSNRPASMYPRTTVLIPPMLRRSVPTMSTERQGRAECEGSAITCPARPTRRARSRAIRRALPCTCSRSAARSTAHRSSVRRSSSPPASPPGRAPAADCRIQLLDVAYSSAHAVAAHDPSGVEKSDDRRTAGPGLKEGVREPVGIRRADMNARSLEELSDPVLRHEAMKSDVWQRLGPGARLLIDCLLARRARAPPGEMLRFGSRAAASRKRCGRFRLACSPPTARLCRAPGRRRRRPAGSTTGPTTRLCRPKLRASARCCGTCLHQHQIGASDSPAVQLAVAPMAHQQRLGVAIGVAGDAERDLAPMAAREQHELCQMRAGATRVVNVGVGPAQGVLEFRPAGMQKAHHGDALVGPVRLVSRDAIPGRAVRPARNPRRPSTLASRAARARGRGVYVAAPRRRPAASEYSGASTGRFPSPTIQTCGGVIDSRAITTANKRGPEPNVPGAGRRPRVLTP